MKSGLKISYVLLIISISRCEIAAKETDVKIENQSKIFIVYEAYWS